MIVNLVLEEGKVIRISGPANVEVLSGEVLVAGATYTALSKFIINRFRVYGVRALKRSELKVVLGDGASIEEPKDGEEVVDSWINLCENLLRHDRPLRVIILGPVESGKTSLTAFIANYLLSRGREVYIVDADIGQEDVATPCTIGVARPTSKFLWLRDLQPIKIKFVGCNSPQYCPTSFIAAFQEVIAELKDSKYDVVVNTDGWVGGYSALEMKQLMIRSLKPTHVLALDDELYNYLVNSLRGSNFIVISAPRPKVVKERSREDRRFLRHQAYVRVFSNARRVKLNFNEISLIGACVLTGKKVSLSELSKYVSIPQDMYDKVVYSSIFGNTINLVLKRGCNTSNIGTCSGLDLNVVTEGEERGLLVGILDDDMRDVGVGIIDEVNYVDGVIHVLTSWSGGIGGLILGRVKLNEKYEEISRVSKCLL